MVKKTIDSPQLQWNIYVVGLPTMECSRTQHTLHCQAKGMINKEVKWEINIFGYVSQLTALKRLINSVQTSHDHNKIENLDKPNSVL